MSGRSYRCIAVGIALMIADEAFLAQFRGKKRGDSLQIGKDLTAAGKEDDLSNQVALAVRKAGATINAVFAK